MSAHPWVRPYVLTGGRTATGSQLYVHTLVAVQQYDPVTAAGLSPEARRLYEQAACGTQSVAELSAHCGLSLGVTRVLLEDLTATGQLDINPGMSSGPYDNRVLQRVINGLRELA